MLADWRSPISGTNSSLITLAYAIRRAIQIVYEVEEQEIAAKVFEDVHRQLGCLWTRVITVKLMPSGFFDRNRLWI